MEPKEFEMKRSWLYLIPLAAALVLTALAFASEFPKYHEGAGVVQGVGPKGEFIILDHDEIPGFMKAMLMRLEVEPPSPAQGLKPGDRVRLRLKETEERLTAVGLERVKSEAPLASYTLEGVLMAFLPATKAVIIRHEGKKDALMPAVERFFVQDYEKIAGLILGDRVKFKLFRTSTRTYAGDLEKIKLREEPLSGYGPSFRY